MFAKTIVLSDEFLDMPLGARCLYMTMGMMADDDGFVNNAKTIIRMVGSTEDDLKILVAKKFVIPFDDGVIVIKHWRINNFLRNDRYSQTKYLEHKAELLIDEKGAYTMNDDGIPNIGIPNNGIPNNGIPSLGIPRLGKDSIGKERVGKDSNKNTLRNEVAQSVIEETPKRGKNDYPKLFEELWQTYPRRKEKSSAYRAYKARLNDGFSEEELLTAVKRYAKECKETHREERYIKLCATFIGPNTPFMDYLKGGEQNGRDDQTNTGEVGEGTGRYDDYAKEYFAKRGIEVQ